MPQKPERPERLEDIIDELYEGGDDARSEPDDTNKGARHRCQRGSVDIEPRIVD